ncbi:hypothetical protein R9C00_22985 [Flammeovirgaceae bacterium SG7u.111]|nr:hypothetical protein [Flammeovirgaceae bacterium SG7u.132]WPO34570.1 hypothetical protein R9C00_22985 [Flammeovirgaceae bacterium SG7u.111]
MRTGERGRAKTEVAGALGGLAARDGACAAPLFRLRHKVRPIHKTWFRARKSNFTHSNIANWKLYLHLQVEK